MNSYKYKIHNKNNGIVHSCEKHSKVLAKSLDKIDNKFHNHKPSIRCHEEVICEMASSRMKSEHFTCKLDEPFSKTGLKIKRSKSKENIERCYKDPSVKSKMDCDNSNEKVRPSTCVQDLFHQSMKSKSVPNVQNHNEEDSVDFIPVKLPNKSNNTKKVSQTQKPKSVCSENFKKKRGPTWDQLLKGDSHNLFKNNIKNRIRPSNRNNTSHHHGSENLQDNAKNKVNCIDSKGTKSKDNQILKQNHVPNSPNSDETNNKFQVSNPVKTLEILIEKLRNKILKQPHNDNLNKIILDMENALLKISVEDEVKTTEQEICGSVKSSMDVSDKSPQFSDTKQINIEELDVLSLKKNLKESCIFLQSLCIKQRENCTSHIREKEQLSIQLAESRRLLAVTKSREKDYEKTIGELRLKLQETNSIKEYQSKSVQELTERVAKLKYENEALGFLKTRLKECSAEKEILQSKCCIKDLEIEKLKVLLELKQKAASKNCNNKNVEDYDLKLDIPNDDKGDLFSLPTESILTLNKPRIICSSQASSSPRQSPSPCDSWQHISSIPQDLTEVNDLRNSIVRLFNKMKAETEWTDSSSLELDLEEPLVLSFSSGEDDEEIRPRH